MSAVFYAQPQESDSAYIEWIQEGPSDRLNVSEEISELDAMNIAENRTLFRNVGLLRAYLQRSFAVEEEMLDRERKRIDEVRTGAGEVRPV